MADSPTSVVLAIGSQRIGMAVFEPSKNGGLILKAYDSETISSDPALEASRVSQTRIAVGDLVKRLKIGKTKVRYAISGQSVITRFVKLPPIQDDNIEQLVTFEAQQQFPFPINEVVWDYELIEGGAEKEAAIVAIKKDALDEINDAVNDSGLATAEVDVAPMALYNAFVAAYGFPAEPVLLVDIGAKNSNLLYLEGKRFFTRSVAVGGSSVTAAIAKEYNISFVDAEHQKISNGIVALGGGHTQQLDESVAALAMVVRNALTRLPSEIARTTNYYRSQHGGSAPTRVFLAGGGASLPYTLEFFQEKLNLPVEFFNPTGAFSLGKGLDATAIQSQAHMLGELVGLGLRGTGKSSINIDLVPAVVEQSRAADRRKPFLIGAAAVLLLGLGAWAALQFVAAGKAADAARTMTETQSSLAPYEQEISSLLKKEANLKKIADGFTSAEQSHAFWFDLLAELRGAMASDSVWITDIEPLNGYNPLATDPKTNGRPVVKPDFATAPYGISGLAISESAAPAPRRGSARNAAPEVSMTANAVRIKGYWLENSRGHNIISEMVTRLREKSTSFRFEAESPDARGKSKEAVPLRDEQIILKNSVAVESGELALPFEIVLPLAHEVSFK